MTKILVVDDSPTVLFKMARDLEAMGYQPLGASEVDEALRYARYARPELVLLDLEMEPLSGVEVGLRLLEVDPALSIIIHSSKSTARLIDAAGRLRAVGIVRKGSSRDRLQAVLERSVRLRHASGEHVSPTSNDTDAEPSDARDAAR